MKKTAAFLLAALFLVLPMLASCAKLDTTGLLEAAPELIERSALFNRIYYGEGIPYLAGGVPNGVYYPADPAYLQENGFRTVAELKGKTREVFSEGYCAVIFSTAFSGFSAEGSGYVYARYASSQAEGVRDERESILVSSASGFLEAPVGHLVYDYATLRITQVERDYACLTLSVTTTITTPAAEGGTPETRTETAEMEIKFVYEDGWRIDSPTY